MDKRKIIAAALVGVALASVPASSYAARCCWRRPFRTRAASFRVNRGYASTFAAANYSACSSGACDLNVSTCEPCSAVGSSCELTAQTVEPCAPVAESLELAGQPCEPCAPVAESLELATQTVEPCAPVQGASFDAVAVDQLLAIVNETRRAHGLPEMSLDANLRAGAYRQARVSAYYGELTHGAGVAEILAQNTSGIRTAVNQWLKSASHRSLLLNAGYRYAGVAVYRDAGGRAWCAVRFR